MTPAADALPISLFPNPNTFGEFSVYDLLRAASNGRIGLDQRVIRSILEREDKAATVGELVKFAAIAGEQPLDLRADLIEIFRRFRAVEALPFYLDVIREFGDDYPDELIEAIVEVGKPAIEPLLELYEQLGEENGAPVAFLLAGLEVRDDRILKLLLEEFEYDTWEGAFHLGMYGDPAGVPAVEKRLTEPDLDDEMRNHLKGAIAEMKSERTHSVVEPPDIYPLFDETAGPDFDVLPLSDLSELLKSPFPDYRAEALEALSPEDIDDEDIGASVLQLARTDGDANVKGRAWEALASCIDENADLLNEMKAVLNDKDRPAVERSGVLVALATATEGSGELTSHIKEMYEIESERKHVIKAMWRSMDQSFGSYMVFNLDDADPEVAEQAIFGIGYLGVKSEVNRLEKFFESDRLRSPALFNYAMLIPGPKERMGVKQILSKIEKIAKGLSTEEKEIVKVALDRRLALRGMKPVFHEEPDEEEGDEE